MTRLIASALAPPLFRCETSTIAMPYFAASADSGASSARTSALTWLSVPPRYAETGSTISSARSGREAKSASSLAMSVLRLSGRWIGAPVGSKASITPSSISTFVTSAPAASSRGRMVSATSSSADSMATLPSSHGVPSTGQRPALVTTAARAQVICDFPSPGWPAIMVILPRAMRPGQSQSDRHGLDIGDAAQKTLPAPRARWSSGFRSLRMGHLVEFGRAMTVCLPVPDAA